MARVRKRHLIRMFFFSFSALPLGLLAMASGSTLTPKTITTQDRFGAVILWDATPYVEQFAQRGTSLQDALRVLEIDAVTLFVRNAPALPAHHLRVVVSYVQTGQTEARYQTKNFEGVKTILTVEGNISARMHFPKGWLDDVGRGVVPAGLRVEVAHDLPSVAH